MRWSTVVIFKWLETERQETEDERGKKKEEKAKEKRELAEQHFNPFPAKMSLENDQKRPKFETLQPFCLVSRTGMWKDFHQNG